MGTILRTKIDNPTVTVFLACGHTDQLVPARPISPGQERRCPTCRARRTVIFVSPAVAPAGWARWVKAGIQGVSTILVNVQAAHPAALIGLRHSYLLNGAAYLTVPEWRWATIDAALDHVRDASLAEIQAMALSRLTIP